MIAKGISKLGREGGVVGDNEGFTLTNGLVGEEFDFNGGGAVGAGVLSNGFHGAHAEFSTADIDAEGVVVESKDFF